MTVIDTFFAAVSDTATQIILASVIGSLVLASIVTFGLQLGHFISDKRREELWKRIGSWWILITLIILPILLGRVTTIVSIYLLSIFCFREFSRATGLFRERLLCILVLLGITLVNFAALDHWYGFFMALSPLVVISLAGIPIFQDRPEGYIQRVALAIFGFMLFGYSFAHLSYLANDARFHPILLSIIFLTELNDVFGYICGSLFGKRKLCPNTSPGKTVAGAVGALICTSVAMVLLGSVVFRGTPLSSISLLCLFGLIIGVVGQLGDLVLSSVKRDLGVKDLGTILPGHGGLLDRFDSLTLVAPAAFHFIGYFIGFGLDQPVRLLTGAG